MFKQLALLAGIGAALAAPGVAGAATLTVTGGAATLTGDATANTLVAVDVKGLGTFFGDQTASTTNPGILAGCTALNGAPAPFPGVICINVKSVTIDGGDGADQLVANPGHPATLIGGTGDDTLVGGAEDDVLRGDAGTDRVAYVAPTGAGIDRTAGVRATLAEPGAAPTTGNGTAATGEDDTIASDVEGLVGGQGDDSLTGNAGDNVIAGAAPPGTPSVATAPAGEDTIVGGKGDDTLLAGDSGSVDGGDGKDTIVGGRSTAARTTVLGGSGADSLVSGLGSDTFSGGSGVDIVAYASASAAGLSRTDGITLRLPAGGRAGTGGRTGGAEHDVFPADDVETWVGGNGSDVLIGNDQGNQLVGVAPAGTAGVTPGPAGDDVFVGGGGPDVLLGAEGDDRMTGGAGDDAMISRAGDDTLLSADGRAEGLSCGDGADTVRADRLDRAQPDCETVTRSGRKPDTAKPRVSLAQRRVLRGHRLRVFVRCRNERRGCKGTIRIRLGKRTLARKAFSVKGRKRKRVTLRLSRKAVKRLKRRGRTAVVLRVRARDRSGNVATRRVGASVRR